MRYNSHTMKLILLSIQFSIFNVITELCKNHRNLRIFFYIPQKETPVPTGSRSPVPTFLLTTIDLLGASVDFSTLDISCKWNLASVTGFSHFV